ncbi:Protease Do-like 8 [Ranunculus cassubicifolius]
MPVLTSRSVENHTEDLCEVTCNRILSTTRRMLFVGSFVSLWPASQALALGNPSLTIEEVTPPVYPSEGLFPYEGRIVKIFEKNTYSVVNIFDVTLRPQFNVTGVVEIPEGNGSGVVWDAEGHIVTNYHVVGNALSRNPKIGEVVARVNILASEGVIKNFEGILVGADRDKDLCVLKVEASEDLLRPINVGESSQLRVGQQCLAIGNPFGFDHTLTVGVLSGLNREIFSKTGVTIGGGIQTDAAINPGNSGGPLLDSKGNMIGINTAIFTQTGTSAGVGFAIPSSTVLKIVPQLIQFGKVVRAGLNVDFAPDLVTNQLNVRNGALILQVPGNGSAAKAGLRPTSRGFAGKIVLGDIILAVDKKPVRNKAELSKVLDEYNVGDKVVLDVQRGNENIEVPLMLEESSS